MSPPLSGKLLQTEPKIVVENIYITCMYFDVMLKRINCILVRLESKSKRLKKKKSYYTLNWSLQNLPSNLHYDMRAVLARMKISSLSKNQERPFTKIISKGLHRISIYIGDIYMTSI